MEKLSNLFGQVFYTHLLSDDSFAADNWRALSAEVWQLAQVALELPAMALPVAMCLYNYFWCPGGSGTVLGWQGPESTEANVMAGYQAVGRCGMDFYIQQCHLRWRYLLMLTAETARNLLLQDRNILAGSKLMSAARSYLREMKQLPNVELLQGFSTHEVSFNMDYFPAATLLHGPVWKNPVQLLPVAKVLEDNYLMIRSELEGILKAGTTFHDLDQTTRNAETQFGPRGDDWLTAYLFRKGEPIPQVCAHAPQTCELLRQRPEIGQCKQPGSGAGFLRMRPSGRLKPHFGNAPRLSVHLGLIIPDGEITMSVGYEEVRWEEGKVIAFDDTFIHQVVHNGLEPRYVMNLWMCHPCDPFDGRLPGSALPEYCGGPPGAMHRLGLQPLPAKPS
ncbi:Aspartyl/asparaginyl beta-hydroxylase (Aspartate beta-hydroxylase) (ASP beta-hydroxylase) (Peptide-aspartate beta-dioxygenase) [Durusdinium trenchii]|uniref:Aspartyl/asparaginyl beta-hydroxylase (Aspartate beta-hydroxylase) (ASP beta-hydroxylase) (Peptide-aspartate beta-dioxygenase) n=1 Tax=Durusdinium trenchii TaxID=1381693 RepID=A0ABP0JTP6_9DINO